MSKPAEPFPKLQHTVADGCLGNVLFRRDQLRQLQECLRHNKDAAIGGIDSESENTPGEAFAEVHMALSAIELYHDNLKPTTQLAAEYRIAKGRDAPDAREAIGIFLVVPQKHVFAYSTLVPLAAAIAAENCVVVVLEQTLQTLASLLANILRDENHIQLIQTGNAPPGAPKLLLLPVQSLVVAIVDRTASVEEAAKAAVDARMEFSGRSPYVPDLVLMTGERSGLSRSRLSGSVQKATGAEARQDGIRAITSGTNSNIFDIVDRASLPSPGKVTERSLYVQAIRSLGDAVEVANDLCQSPMLTVYTIADLPSAKYLLQFILAYAGFADSIPAELGVRPKYCQLTLVTPFPSNLAGVLNGRQTNSGVEEALLKEAEVESRAPVRRISGYFESAVVIGLAPKAIPVVVGLGALEFNSANDWKKCGDEALANGIKGVLVMGAHWAAHTHTIDVATHPAPKKNPVAYVHPSNSFLIRIFPDSCPPTTIVLMSPWFDPHYHMHLGLALWPLRAEGYLLIGSDGAVHNLYRNVWETMIRQSVENVITRGGGPRLRRGVTGLMKHLLFRDAHATDDQLMSMFFVRGGLDWDCQSELKNVCNSQFTIGIWKGYRVQ
ncbi:hypothetical protein C8A03DRAFT_46567 [Achaetomium macrosporum]|uniref:Aldehyde dehydrogenase domain-containing protein n=1 Tax=Achaetomium macrosporum TaxID=79813 RepID=A0AAN7C4J8_9PEZI|nr:hypothetical protein C8A03DRAFT_46567 [Achaetomium macrosporum]